MDLRECPECGKMKPRSEMEFSRDCHGIPFRLLCFDCISTIYETKGYDGQYYDERDECIDEYY